MKEASRTLLVSADGLPDGHYEVMVQPGLLHRLPSVLAERVPGSSYPVVADERVAELYGASLAEALRQHGLHAPLLTFPPGEGSKNREVWARLMDGLLEEGVDREAVVLSVGGGVTGDLAGFVAATCLRGLRVVQVPTSLVAMVDSSVGGKTGVDVPAGKNLVGAFHPPSLVAVDPETVRTLPRARRAEGLAEVVKHGAIRDRAHLEEVEGWSEPLLAGALQETAAVVYRSVQVKAQVVGQDEREGGLRRILNFGHTVGHALEVATDYRMPHGEAVAAGMVAEARLGEALGVTEAGTAHGLERVLQGLDLPVRVPAELDPEAVVLGTRTDKKGARGRARYVLLRHLGAVAEGEGWVHSVEEGEVRTIIRSLGAEDSSPV